MSKELIVSTGKHETRVAILEDDQLVEIYHEREKEYSLAGSIHKGRVTRVLPGMQSAFVDIGLERDAFLYVSDFFEDGEEYDAVVSTAEDKVLSLEAGESAPAAERPEGERDRGGRGDRDRNRDRGRNRDRNRDRGPRDGQPREGQQREGQARPVAAADAVLAVPSELTESAAAMIETGVEPGVELVAAAAAAPAMEHRRQGQEGRADRGGRGRRRRGRGGRLPDSKYASPREFSAVPAERSVSAPFRNHEERNDEAEDFIPIILAGESLAKYSGIEPSQLAAPRTSAAASGIAFEAGSEAEHTEPEPQLLTAEAAAEAMAELHEEIQEAIAAVEPAVEEPIAPEPIAAERIAAEPPSTMETSVESTPAAVVEPRSAEVVEEVSEPSKAAEVGDFSEIASIDESEEGEVSAEAVSADAEEGPEPARIPTSLTAQLREQGHRYPHRISRRLRRKMRQGDEMRQSGEMRRSEERSEPREGAAEAIAVDPPIVEAETRIVEDSAPAEVKPVQQRDDNRRRDRDRGGRDRGERPERTERPDRERPALPSIADLLKEGQEIIVQIAKEPIGQKGARITSHIALPGRFVVYMPTVEHVGVSRKIPSDDERMRLKKVLATHRQGIPGGFICRTAAEGKTEEELRSDMHFLYNLWLDLRQKAEKRPAPMLLHHDLDLVQRILRDQITSSFKAIWVDSEELYEGVLSFMQRHQPALVSRVKMYTRPTPIFDEFGITAELEKALRPKVWLKSGGYIVINQTEALVAIDINTGKYVGKSNRLEDTIVKVNTDAIKEIVRQIRLRDLGGIIVVDFIDMEERRNRAKVMQVLEEAMRADRAPNKILQFNDFGLVAITRKRVKQSLERTLCTPCPYCEGAGHVKSVQTVIGEILTEAQRMQKALEEGNSNVVLRVNPEVAKVLKSNKNTFLQEIEEIAGKSVMVKSDPSLHQTKFDLA
jgi:ribonuclease G